MTDTVSVRTTAQLSGDGPLTGATTDQPFPELLRSCRVRAGLTQQALAAASTVSPRAIRDLEAGRANARPQTIHLLADGLKLNGLTRDLFICAGLNVRQADPLGGDFCFAAPKPVNVLLGRETEVRTMADELESDRRRMICISGLPGVGKTRVAAEIATRLSTRRGWPVLWIGMGGRAITGLNETFSPLMRLLHSLVESDIESIARVCRLVGRRETLLVLDGAADIKPPSGVAELLAYCPGMRVITTSRIPWHVMGVQSAVVSPLATPKPAWDAGYSCGLLANVPAVRLFVDRLAEVRPGFSLNAANVGAVAELCRMMDGLPLALEAAAARCRVLTLQQLAEVPVRDLLHLVIPSQPGEHETIGGLLSWSIGRLDVAHRAMLRVLVRSGQAWTAVEAATALRRPLDEVVDDLNVLIGYGLVQAVHKEHATALVVPNLLRSVLLRLVSRQPRRHTRFAIVGCPLLRPAVRRVAEGMRSTSSQPLRNAKPGRVVACLCGMT